MSVLALPRDHRVEVQTSSIPIPGNKRGGENYGGDVLREDVRVLWLVHTGDVSVTLNVQAYVGWHFMERKIPLVRRKMKNDRIPMRFRC